MARWNVINTIVSLTLLFGCSTQAPNFKLVSVNDHQDDIQNNFVKKIESIKKSSSYDQVVSQLGAPRQQVWMLRPSKMGGKLLSVKYKTHDDHMDYWACLYFNVEGSLQDAYWVDSNGAQTSQIPLAS